MIKDNHLSESTLQASDRSNEQQYLQFRQLHVRPWIRFWAKTFDIGILSAILNLLLFCHSAPCHKEFLITKNG